MKFTQLVIIINTKQKAVKKGEKLINRSGLNAS
jgi:hypothetical protein